MGQTKTDRTMSADLLLQILEDFEAKDRANGENEHTKGIKATIDYIRIVANMGWAIPRVSAVKPTEAAQ